MITRTIQSIVLSLFIMALVLVACAPAPQKAATPTVSGSGSGAEATDLAGFISALRAAGATVQSSDAVDQPFFSVKGQNVIVNGAQVQVFEYVDEAARKAESSQISQDGSTIGPSMVSWVDQPNFWASGRLIVLNVGQDAATINLLSSVLGDPITRHG